MANIHNVIRSFKDQPAYTAMRGLARFPIVRDVASSFAATLSRNNLPSYLADASDGMQETLFPQLDCDQVVDDLRRDGLAFGFTLPPEIVSEIRSYAENVPVYADRDPTLGFMYSDRLRAEDKLKKPILLAQYFNTLSECDAVRRLSNDPALRWIAAKYLGAVPAFFGSNLWWTFPVKASLEDRDRHAHFFHRDVDDFRFFKYFFYITTVPEGEGAHICVAASHRNPPKNRVGDQWNIRRYSDEEISRYYKTDDIKEICGPAGTGFAENTLCIHKGSTPKSEARLLLQLQFGLFDYGAMSDRVESGALRSI